MAATGSPSTSAGPRFVRSDRPHSYPFRPQEDYDSETTALESEDLQDQPDVHELRRVRAQVFRQSGKERKGATNRETMASHTVRDRHSDSRAYGTKAPSVTVREVPEVRRKRSSGRRHHRHSAESEDDDEDEAEETIYVYKSHKSGKRAERDVPGIIRRTTTRSDATRSRPRNDDDLRRNTSSHGVPSRKNSERRSVYRDDPVHNTVRREKRSTAENGAPRISRSGTPVKR